MHSVRRERRWAIAVLFGISLGWGEGAAVMASGSGSPLSYRIELASPLAGEDVRVRFVITNAGAEPLTVLKWYTPLEGIAGNILQVVCDGKVVPYKGPQIKRGQPGPDDYVTVDPGKSVSGVVALSEAYDLPAAGECTVAFKRPVQTVTSPARPDRASRRNIVVHGNTLQFRFGQ